MGRTLKITALFLVLFLFVSLEAREAKRPVFTPVKIDFRLLQGPRIKAGTVSSVNRGSLNLTNRRWGVVEITYRPRFDYEDSNSAKRKNTVPGLWLDDVVCGVRVIACDRSARTNPALALFSTRVEFWTVSLDWRDHKYFVYLPPMLIERVMPSRKNDSKLIKVASEADFVIGVTFFHKKWGVLGEAYYSPKTRVSDSDFRSLLRGVPQNNIFHGSLISRANSPWGLNDQEEFDVEKPAFIPAPLDEAAIEKAAASAAGEEAASAEDSRKRSSSANGRKNRKVKR